MVFQNLPGFRKNPNDMEQRSMFELLEILSIFNMFHFSRLKSFVELVRRQIHSSGKNLLTIYMQGVFPI